MENVILVLVIGAVLGLACFSLYRAKKNGKKCIGCPDGCNSCSACSGKGKSSCSCKSETEKKS
ncbi:MAG: FeoB-associated Cys-rich membrane protein [Clostridia bacterium]|nr:FeoB-associated Cys-rich membrane protein [Clostridia bacterium]